MSLNPWSQHKNFDIPRIFDQFFDLPQETGNPDQRSQTLRTCDPKIGSYTLGSLYRPPSMFSNVDSLWHIRPPWHLSQNICSRSRILTSSNSTWWSGDSIWMCWETSDEVELGRRCSWNLVFSDLSVSPM